MSKIVFLIVITLTAVFAQVNFVKDYKTALKMAKDQDKKILIMLTAKDCNSCWWMKNVAFKDEQLSQRINENIVSVEIDVNDGVIPLNLRYIGTPTFYLLDKNEDQLSRMDGRVKIQKFHQRLDIFLD